MMTASAPSAAVAQQPPPPLRRNWRFQLLWIGATSTTLGVEAVDVAYPLLVLTLTGSPALAGLFGFVQAAVSVLLGLPIGRLVDRWNHRSMLIGAEAVRALATGSVALAIVLGHLTMGHLMAVAVVLGAGTAFGGPVRMLLVRAVVPPSQLTQALTQDEVREGAAGLVGPAVGGSLYGVARLLPFVACATTFTLSLICTLFVRIPPRQPEAGHGAVAPADGESEGMFAGVLALWRNPMLRGAIALIGTFYLVITAVTLTVVVTLRSQHVAAGLIGVALTGSAVGMLLGSLLVGRLHGRMTPGRLLLTVSGVVAGAVALLTVPLGPWWVFGCLLLATLTVPALRVLIDIMILRQVSEDRRGRTIVAVMTVLSVGPPLGTMAAGLLLQFTSPLWTIAALAAVQAAVTLYGLGNSSVAQARWPE
ncbi:MFS family permease [Streptacidiphilus sp. MAP12-20]|uniref:MFS transporter n=1 Tax=Streptacidiphilus sp. MAP12-20 TaxID=3156299 RepID=UPI0035147FA7